MNISGGGKINKQPNILFFFTDDQRFDTISALGNPEIITPNMDKLVARGVSFRNAYIMGGTSCAVCMPSRAMLHTGRTLFHIQEEGQNIPSGHALMGESFRQAGYATFGTGKWHNGPNAYARSFTHGAEIFFGGMGDHWNVQACDFDSSGRYKGNPYCKSAGCSNELKTRNVDHIKAGHHSSELFCDAAIDFLQNYQEDQPFFMYVSFMAPHDPRTMPKKYLDMYNPEKIKLPENFMLEHPFDIGWYGRDEQLEKTPRPEAAIRKHIAEYYAMITHLDAEMGRVLEALDESGRAEDTIIVFAGDNGLAVGQHGLMGKQSVYEHSVHVPLIMAGPNIPSGKESNAFCYLIDIFPTLCELTGMSIPDSVEGKSLLAAIKGDDRVRDTLYFAYENLHRGVRDQRYKLIEYVVKGERHTQLFDLQDDPREINNLAADAKYAEDIKRLRKELLRWRDELDDSRPKEAAFWQGYSK